MRLFPSLAWLLWACALGACSRPPPEQAPLANVAPIGPNLDWASLASRAKPLDSAAAESPAAGSAVALDSSAASRPPEAAPAAIPSGGPRSKPAARADTGAAAKAATKRHPLFSRLPKDALLVIDVADVSALRGALSVSELNRLYSQPAVAAQVQPLLDGLNEQFESLCVASPEFDAALALLPTLGGRLAFSLSGLDAESLGASTAAIPWVATVIYDAGEQADLVAGALAPLLATQAQKLGLPLREKAEPAWGCELGSDSFLLDLERHEDRFELRAGGRSSVVRELAAARKRSDASSFISTRVASDASDVRSMGATALIEAHLQITPVWEALRIRGDRTDMRLLERTGLAHLLGASLAVGRTKDGLAEALTLHSPAGVDLLTHLVTGRALDPSLARCVPAELQSAGLFSLDGSRLVADLCLLIPAEAQSGLVRALGDFRRNVGIDAERDILGVFGPTFALASSDLPEGTQWLRVPRLFAACQLSDPSRAQRTLNALLVASGRFPDLHEQLLGTTRMYSLDFVLESVPWPITLHWCFEGDVLLVSSERNLLREGLAGLRAQEVAHIGLREALAGVREESFAVGFAPGRNGSPQAISYGLRTHAGLELTSADGTAANSCAAALFLGGMCSAIAIPQLLAARMDANQQAAIAQMTLINSAEARASEARELDLDGDGLGEYLFLDELCGTASLRGSANPGSKRWLDSDLRWVGPGIGATHGYRFRVDLRRGDGGSAWNAINLGDDRRAIDLAEFGYVAYAWPDSTSQGHTVFVFDPEIGLYCSDNRAAQQRYAGEHGPKVGAHLAAEGFSNDAVRRVGRDGGIWLRLRGL